MRRLPIRAALTAWYLLVLGLVITGFAAALYWDQEQTLSGEIDRSIAGASGQALALIDKHVDPIRFVDNDAYRHATRHLTQAGYAVLLFDADRRPLARFGRTLELAAPPTAERSLDSIETSFDGSDEHWRISWQPVVRHDGVTVGYLAVGQSIDTIEQALHNLYLTLLWAVPVTLALAGVAGFGLARLAMRPVDRMTQFVRALGAHDLGKRLAYCGPDDELGRLATTLDDMLARLETDTAPWEETAVDVSQLCERIVEQMQPLAAERGLAIDTAIEPGLLVAGSFDHLLRALLNLLDNAIKYAHSPSRIVIEGSRSGGTIRIQVSNDGRVLDQALIGRVGERFLRSEGDRSRETGGVGLGLAIAAEIARRHRGALSLSAKAGGGAVATLDLTAIA